MANLKRQGFSSLEHGRSPAPFGFSTATGPGSYTHSTVYASSLWPLTDLGQNYEMPERKNYFLYRERLLPSPCPGCRMQSLGHHHKLQVGGHPTGKQVSVLSSPHLGLLYRHWTSRQERKHFSQDRVAVQGADLKLQTSV